MPAALSAITTLLLVRNSTPAEAFADNIRRLMARDGISQNELGKLAGIAQTNISGLVKKSLKPKNPKFETLAKLAAHFKVEPWLLLVPEIPLELLSDHSLSRVLASYTVVSDKGRQMILHVAEQEARYTALDADSSSRKAG